MEDRMEAMIADALDKAGIRYTTGNGGGNPAGLDFNLIGYGVEIEVKRLHSPRIAEQMSRAPNVIAAQGDVAVRFLADAIAGLKNDSQPAPNEVTAEIQPVFGPRHALQLLDHANELINFCAVHMPDAERYNRGGWAFWSVCHWIAALDRPAPPEVTALTQTAADRAEIERLRAALDEIAETTKRQQLPITAQVNDIARQALEPKP